jgi:ElaB/YqjD/DUF883 family membrane-anchored ribosome-binding protein
MAENTLGFDNLSGEALAESFDKARKVGKRVVEHGYESAREYADEGMEWAGDMSKTLTKFVRHEPWMAVAGAFVFGYLVAQVLRKISD